MNSPAVDIQARLVTNSIGSDPSSSSTWPIYVSILPEDYDDCIAVFDLSGSKPDYSTGYPVYNDRVEIVVRSTSYTTGYSKVTAIMSNLEQANSFTYSSMVYVGCELVSGPSPLGIDSKGRELFSLTFSTPRQHS